jgi:asparagine synthase (glutamine-hydrolysing)
MCGIAGFIGIAPIPHERLDACKRAMRHRGPDACGEIAMQLPGQRNLYLLHSRLAIIDLDSRSNQPFECGHGVLTYNGEIYNYKELRAELIAAGETLQTDGDTEVLARMLAREAERGLSRCEGMWAFAWYDTRRDELMLSRDRFGEKPLYVWSRKEGIYFASEAKFLFALAGERPRANLQHLKRYLVNGYKSLYKTAHTFFEGVRELPGGTCGVIDGKGNYRESFFWKPSFPRSDDSMTYEQAVAGTRERLMHSMCIRLRADVPVAFCLSGGVDSNALIAIAKRELGYDVHGFTIMNSDRRYEEREMVETSVRELGLRHTAVPIETRNFLQNLRTLVRVHDAPVYTITYYAHWRLMEAIGGAGYKVSVSGTAADELFSGYFDHHNAYLAAVAKESGSRHASALQEWREQVAPIVRNPFLQDPHYFLQHPESRDHIYLDADEFACFLTSAFREEFTEESYTAPLLRNRMANELFHESVPVILHEDDLNAMSFSIENRSPYLDTELFDWCQQIPTRHLVRNGRAKAVLRDAVRGIAPDAIIDNPRKVGFNAPILDYLDLSDRCVRDELMAESPVFDLIRRDRIEELVGQTDLPNSRSKFLFNFVNAKMFLEEFAA